MTVNIYFIRHAQSTANVDPRNLIGGKNPHVKLTKEGEIQAKLLGQHFKKKGVCCDLAYSSGAVRTQSTAQIVLKEIGYKGRIVIDEDLVERGQGDWQGKPRSIYKRPDVVRKLAKDSWNFKPGDRVRGESENEVAHRMVRVLQQIVFTNTFVKTNIFVFSHAHAIRCMLAMWCDLEVSDIYIDNTSVTLLRFHDVFWIDPFYPCDDGICSKDLWANTDHLNK